MAAVLGLAGALAGEERAEAAERCRGCTERDACRQDLGLAKLRGAGQAPGYCRNADLFDRLASEAPASL